MNRLPGQAWALSSIIVFGAITPAFSNDDLPRLTFSGHVIAYESEGSAHVELTLQGDIKEPASIEYITRDDDASAPQDYYTKQGKFEFLPGESRIRNIFIQLRNDNEAETVENLLIEFFNPQSLEMSSTTVTVEIVDSSVITPEPIDATPVISHTPPDKFLVFNTMLYKNMPSVGQRAPVVYERSFFGDYPPNADGTPSQEAIANAKASAESQYGPPWNADSDLVIIDIERWHIWPFVDFDEHRDAVGKYSRSLAAFGEAYPVDSCMYAIAPQAGINHAIRSTVEPQVRADWNTASEAIKELLVPEIAALCPSLYTYYDSYIPRNRLRRIEDWKVFARETIKEARRIAPDKPVYPFIWPQFHSGGNVSGYPFLPEEYWRAQLETMRDYADGLVLWGGWDFELDDQLLWQEQEEWWIIFQEVFPDH